MIDPGHIVESQRSDRTVRIDARTREQWHVVDEVIPLNSPRHQNDGTRYVAVCGQEANENALTGTELPAGKACQECLRIARRREEARARR